MRYEKPVHFAAGFVFLNALLNAVIYGYSFQSLLASLVLFAYTAFVYMVVDRYGDQLLAPIGVLIVGALIFLGAAFYT